MLLGPATRSRAFSSRNAVFTRVSSGYRPRFVSTAAQKADDFDVVIVGGGPAGLALAGALVSKRCIKESLRIGLVEGSDLSKVRQWTQERGTYSNRAVSLTNVSQSFLKNVGAWSHLDIERTGPVIDMQVWDGLSDARITFSASDMGLECPEDGMSRITENFNLQRSLLRYLDSNPSVSIIDKAKVSSIVRDSENGNWPLVQLENDRVLRARLLVGADGQNSAVRLYAKIPIFGWSYDGQAIVATLHHTPRNSYLGPNTTAFQRFLPTGPIAFLPFSETASSLVWSTKPALATALKAADADVLRRMINAAFRLPESSMAYLHSRILERHASCTPISANEIQEEIRWREESHSIDPDSSLSSSSAELEQQGIPPTDAEMYPPLVTSIQPGTVASFPLRFNHAEAYIGTGAGARTVLVGDAAHTVHPLAGQGLNLGLADVECLGRVIEQAVLRGGDIGSYTALLPYASERYLANHSMMSAMDKLQKLYSPTFSALPLVIEARSIGVEVLNEMDTLKGALMMAAGAHVPIPGSENRQRGGGDVFGLAASGVEALSTLASVGGTLTDGARSTLTNVLGQAGKDLRSRGAGKL